MFRFNDELGILASLAEIDMPEIALDFASDFASAAFTDTEIPNPRPVSHEDVRAGLDDVFYERRGS